MIKKLGSGCLVVLALIIAMGFYLRCESVSETNVIAPLRADAGDHFNYAYNLRHKGTYSRTQLDPSATTAPVSPDAVRSPGYPLFILPFVDGPPSHLILGKIIICQAGISTLTIIVAFFFFLKFLPRSGALVASLLVSLSPHLIIGNSYVLTESLFCFLLVLSAWSVSLLPANPSPLRAGFTGVFLGMASLVRPVLQFFPIGLAIPFVNDLGRIRGMKLWGALLLGFVLTLSPWISRNLITLGKPGDSTLMISFLHHGMYPGFMFNDNPDSYAFPYRYDPRTNEIGSSFGAVLTEISTRLLGQPAKHLEWFLVGKPIAFWSWNTVQGAGDAFIYPISSTPYISETFFRWTHSLMYGLHWPLVILCLLGSLLVWFPNMVKSLDPNPVAVARLAASYIIYFTLLHMLGAPFPRYAFPLRPFQYGMAVFSIILIYTYLRNLIHRPHV